MSEALSMDFPFTMQKGTEFVLHSECLHIKEYYKSITQGLASKVFEMFPYWFDVPVIGFESLFSQLSPRENHFSATILYFPLTSLGCKKYFCGG